MEPKDLELLNEIVEGNQELAQLWREHLELENRLENLARRPYHSAEEAMEIKRLKKVKLAGRDRIEQILAEYRQADATA